MFIVALFTISQDMKATSVSIDRWVDKEDVVHVNNGIQLSYKKEWNNAIYTNIEGPRDYHTKSQSDKEIQVPYDITYIQNLNFQSKIWIYL